MKVGCVVLAAGMGSRFGGNKLTACVNGTPIINYIFDSLSAQFFHRIVVVTANEFVIDGAQQHNFRLSINDRPELGISRSIRLGLEAMNETDACMFCVADQPLLKQETLSGMLNAYECDTILMVSHNNRRGNPVIYPASLYGELMSLTGEESGKTVANRHKSLLRLFHIADKYQLMDIDTRDDLKALESHLLDKSHTR